MSFELYEFQKEDVAKLLPRPAALIGSEMGTGKTHEAIALDQLWWPETKKPTLVVTPLNTISSPWIEKYSDQAPEVDVYPIDRKNRDKFVRALKMGSADVFLMHWDALRMLAPEFLSEGISFGTVIADEVHRASNRKAQATRALNKIRTVHKLGLSGTASGDKPWNLWSILNWLYPQMYRSYWSFVKMYAVQGEKDVWKKDAASGKSQLASYRTFVGVQNMPRLHQQMDPFYVRHLKREQCCDHHPDGVMWWLPDKVYDKIWVDLSPTQRRLYDQMAKQMVAWVGEHEDSPLVAGVVVAQLTRLSQMALATPELETVTVFNRKKQEEETRVNVKLTEPSSKIDAVKEYIQDNEGKRILVYSSSKQACYLLHASLLRSRIRSEVLSGDTPDSERKDMVQRFVANQFQVFIAVIQAAAEGVDGLQYATDTAIYLDRSWSTIKNKQSEDRLHRGGTKDTVHIIDVMARNTVDLGRHTKLEHKWEWIKAILGDKSAQTKIMKGEL